MTEPKKAKKPSPNEDEAVPVKPFDEIVGALLKVPPQHDPPKRKKPKKKRA